jgi:hypothetical protein
MRALAYRTSVGEAKALIKAGAGKWEVHTVRTEKEGQEKFFSTLGSALLIILEAESVGNLLHIVGQHGGFTAPDQLTAEAAVERALADTVKARDLEAMADRVWKEGADETITYTARQRGRRVNG